MKQTLRNSIVLALLLGTAISSRADGLKDAYKDYFSIGVALNKRNVSTPEQMALVRQEFNSLTAENDMKPVSVHPAEGVWNWGGADSIANFARQ
ncbi:MAG: endo-1,4-beta-xylanase, partial [Prevotella sp.]|nr:endo-1,4-beta-xylanase [Prevotella sp.]